MSLTRLRGKVVDIHLWTTLQDAGSDALDQLKNVAALPQVFHHVAVMPDVHYGKGATVGSVVAMRGAVSPAAVGVDIGCGMAAVRTNLRAGDLPDSLVTIRSAIEEVIPVGRGRHETPVKEARAFKSLWKEFDRLDIDKAGMKQLAMKQCGTLGGGNHFIELSLDTAQNVWLVLHSGSRNVGKTLAETHMWRAKQLQHNIRLPDRDLATFLAGTPEMKAYLRDLWWAQEYAMVNRTVMLQLLRKVLTGFFPQLQWAAEPVLCHHNYVSQELHYGEEVLVTRKGAISARRGELGIIPGSMGARSFIVRGLGNEESFCSASHGAGRRMSRGEARTRFTVAQLAEQTAGVECRKDPGVLDEIPGAYKDIDQVMANQSDLVEIVAELKQVLCVKG
jgi:tRNA-splicing ligase RtcB